MSIFKEKFKVFWKKWEICSDVYVQVFCPIDFHCKSITGKIIHTCFYKLRESLFSVIIKAARKRCQDIDRSAKATTEKNIFKGIFHKKWKICHHYLTLILFQTLMTFFILCIIEVNISLFKKILGFIKINVIFYIIILLFYILYNDSKWRLQRSHFKNHKKAP